MNSSTPGFSCSRYVLCGGDSSGCRGGSAGNNDGGGSGGGATAAADDDDVIASCCSTCGDCGCDCSAGRALLAAAADGNTVNEFRRDARGCPEGPVSSDDDSVSTRLSSQPSTAESMIVRANACNAGRCDRNCALQSVMPSTRLCVTNSNSMNCFGSLVGYALIW